MHNRLHFRGSRGFQNGSICAILGRFMDSLPEQPPVQKQPEGNGRLTYLFVTSLLLFCAVLASVLAFSYYVLLPSLTRVPVSGQLMPAMDVADYRRDLRAELVSLEEDRAAFLRPQRDPVFDALQEARRNDVAITVFAASFAEVAAQVQGDAAIEIEGMGIANDSVSVQGSVRSSRPDTLTVLATFVEQASHIQGIEGSNPASFTRSQDGDQFVSPFDLTFRLSRS